MGKVREKIAYLQGLKDGINLNDQDTAKLIGAVVEVLNSIADSFDEAETRLELIDDCIEDIYEDLEYLNENAIAATSVASRTMTNMMTSTMTKTLTTSMMTSMTRTNPKTTMKNTTIWKARASWASYALIARRDTS